MHPLMESISDVSLNQWPQDKPYLSYELDQMVLLMDIIWPIG